MQRAGPNDTLCDQREHAQALARSAQEALQAIDAAEAELVKSWPPRDLTPEEKVKRRNAEDTLAAAVRTLRTVEGKADAARMILNQATLAVAPLAKEIDAAIAAVVSEEGQMALDHLIESRRQTVEAEVAARSIAAALVASGRLAEAEKISRALYEMPRPEGTVNSAPYLDLMQRLRSDADAELVP